MEETKKNENTQAQPAAQADPVAAASQFSSGTLTLIDPIRDGQRTVTELHYDFCRLTGWEYADAMDSDREGDKNAFRLTNRQALALFAAAAAKQTEGLDVTDIKQRLSIRDAIKAAQIATVFFVASSRAGNERITNS